MNEGKDMRNNASDKKIILLAYLHRYGWTLPILLGSFLPPAIKGWTYVFGFLGCAIWSFVGYKCKWTHIYYSYQNTTNLKMTSNSICWDKITNVNAYGLPVLYLILALVCVFLEVAH
jgi:hypothetical protein